ncbi:dihydropteroate synthase [Tropicimonas isoalkanivorans]|uniref:Dihydropteroate synthase n=1 Tax=Tropicimonas isoalkanivorans TaxID=441112 RepID=A0A1I1NY61_9RHOB|nr:dihydropteroate synthase [Tropicimonas isoalkanivorans]SFC98650.1 Dihydropteroate synthase [Tropicimonas isoalkanivorans]
MRVYYRPIPSADPARPPEAVTLAGGWCWFDRVERLRRGAPAEVLPVSDVPQKALEPLLAPRMPLAGLRLDRPSVMGILNVTPDSFSDGGVHAERMIALTRAAEMASEVEIVDIGGESTRPGADEVPVAEEIERTCPVIADMRAAHLDVPISIDTRKAAVARAALAAGATMVNDVSGLGFDPAMAPLLAETGAPLCLMHSIATPATMQVDPRYDNVLLDVYDALEARVAAAEAAGIDRSRIVVDPGIGFGKTVDHNLALLARLSLFHGLGCAVLLGASRKRFIGVVGRANRTEERLPGSVAAALAAVGQGVQIVRVHDTTATVQALRLFRAATGGVQPEEDR